MNKSWYFLGMVLFLLAIFPENVLSSDSCNIQFKESVIVRAQKTQSLKELYAQTKDKQVDAIMQELDVVMPQVETFWNEVRKKRVVNGVISEDSDEFIKAIAWKKDFGITWHQNNFEIVEEAREIFNAHPGLKRISIDKDAMVMFLQKHKKGIILAYYPSYVLTPENQPEILGIEKDGIRIYRKGNYYFYFSSSYEPDIFKLAEGHIFFICDENNLIIEMKGEKYKDNKVGNTR